MPGNFGNSFVQAILTSPLHPLLGPGVALITVTGRKTGRPITTPINVLADGERLTVVSLRQRTWWRNLRGAQPAALQLAGRQLAVRGEVLEAPPDVAQGLARLFARFPGHAKYFGVRGAVTEADLQRLADRHVVIHLAEVGRV